jgi:hypothetical protein
MPFNSSKSASLDGKILLRFTPMVNVPTLNVVLDAVDSHAFPAPTDGSRFIVPAGTILVDSSVAGKMTKYALADYSAGKKIRGILKEPIDLVANATDSYEPAAAYFSEVVFATESIVDFTVFATQLVADLPFAQFK